LSTRNRNLPDSAFHRSIEPARGRSRTVLPRRSVRTSVVAGTRRLPVRRLTVQALRNARWFREDCAWTDLFLLASGTSRLFATRHRRAAKRLASSPVSGRRNTQSVRLSFRTGGSDEVDYPGTRQGRSRGLPLAHQEIHR